MNVNKEKFIELAKEHLLALEAYKMDKNGSKPIEIFGIEKMYEALTSQCQHSNIVVILQIDEFSESPLKSQETKRFVECEDCGEELPIKRISQRSIIIH